ncbi:MAG: penicillin-binding transpeptidase domain-containing protein [Oscillospiraceae bacterium]
MTDKPTSRMKKKLMIGVMSVIVLLAVYICIKVFITAVAESDKWRELANSQQVKSTVVKASRGTIYDSTNQILAQSSTVYNVYCDQKMLWDDYISKKDEEISNVKAALAKEKDADKRSKYEENLKEMKSSEQTFNDLVDFLAKTLKIDRADVEDKIKDEKQMYVILKKNVEKETADKIEDYLTEEELDGVRCDPTTKRFYPQNTMLSNVIGNLDYDGNGNNGLEQYYNDYLAGVDGRVVTATARNGTEIPYKYKQSYDAQDGDSLYLNIDMNIQYHLETALANGVDKDKPAERACGIIMNPKTGQIYAMATNYSYDPNDPAKITNQEVANELAAMDSSSEEYSEKRLNEWSKQWKNKAISELYFPGSVFKVITGSSALEENVITSEDRFYCNTQIQVADATIHCWSTNDHGSQNFAQAMLNSCNPAFVQIGQKLGAEKFCEYFKAYGLTEPTGIDLPNEATSIYMPLTRMGPVELASSSFGQTNKITPIQMICAYAAAINGGKLMTPHVVDKIVDSDGNVVKSIQPEIKRQVISEETSAKMRTVLEGVVNGSKGSNCYIKGYRIGGKSGTSQKLDTDNSTTYVASYCAFAPADDPEVIMLVMVDHPTGGRFYGSEVAAPICVEVFEDILPYLGLFPEYTDEEMSSMQVSVPNVEYADVEKAKSTIANLGFNVEVVGSGKTVIKQLPSGTSIDKGSTVVLYTDKSYETASNVVTVPDLTGLTKDQAKSVLEQSDLNLTVNGSASDEEGAIASSDQSVAAGKSVPKGTAVAVTFVSGSVHSQ